MSVLDRIRPASFIDADGTEHFFEVDNLERTTSKKGDVQEILDSDESITQDQGLKVWKFTMDAYFTGPDYDIATDAFVAGLSLKYSQDNPGILKHPRWGDINVFPMGISQKEELVKGAFVGHVTVPFVEIFPQVFPTSDLQSLLDSLLNLDEMEEESEEIADGITNNANTNSKLGSAIGTISKAISDGTDKFNTIQATANGLVDTLSDVVDTIATIQRLIRAPGQFIAQTLARVNGYLEMIDGLVNGFDDVNETSPISRKDNVKMMQLVAGFGVGGLCEAAAFTDYSIRSEAITAIEKINEGFEIFDTGFNNARTTGNVSEEYSGDHNFWSLLLDTIRGINQFILTSAFDLAAEKTITLKTNSDIITECYNAYGNVDDDTMDFFILTNRFIDGEYEEIPAGREIVAYV